MPFLKDRNRVIPVWRVWEKKTQRNGYRAAVFGKSVTEKYTGWFKHNAKEGMGYQVYEDGTFYEGEWKGGKRNGHGYISFICPSTKKSLRIYTGQFKDDYPSGFGMKSMQDGSLYKGEFKQGLKNGWGCMFYRDGAIYIGQWVKDQRHGVGRLSNPENGNYYEGAFKQDKKCGLGRYYHMNTGQVQEGVWLDDAPQVTIMFDDPKNRQHALHKTEFEIPELTMLNSPQHVYLERAHEVLLLVKERTYANLASRALTAAAFELK